VLAIDPERPVAAAASMMLDNRVNRLPVLSGGELVGIVTRSDLVRAFTRPDTDIEREIRDEVLLASFWLPKGAVTVTVQDGVVQLHGGTETKADAEILPEMVRRVVGVVAVEAALTWRVDRTVEFEQSRS
jgi:CBS domain-containing protein